MVRYLKVIVSILTILLLINCKQNKTDPRSNKHKIIIDKWHDKKVIIPKSIIALDSTYNDRQKKKSKYTIISYFDGNCGLCYRDLLKWKNIMEDIRDTNPDITIMYILSGYNEEIIKSNLFDVKFPLRDVYYDEKDLFSKKYSFLLESNYVNSSMLIDANSRVLYIGNPVKSKNTKKMYIQLIQVDK